MVAVRLTWDLVGEVEGSVSVNGDLVIAGRETLDRAATTERWTTLRVCLSLNTLAGATSPLASAANVEPLGLPFTERSTGGALESKAVGARYLSGLII